MTPREYVPILRRTLEQNIVGFWYPRCLDRNHGGYIIAYGVSGERKPVAEKMIVTQARMLWLFARLARFGYKPKEMLDAAGNGWQFLKDRMWDAKRGGFYWEMSEAGDKTRGDKHLYGQSFGLYAVSEYAIAAQSDDVRRFAIEVFDAIENKAHDAEYGGYRESFDENWHELDAGEPTPMGSGARLKLMNTHLHLMEALTAFYRATGLPRGRERLLELITIESNSVVRKGLTACTDKYDRDWTPLLEGDLARVSYGHDIENVWLLMDACDTAGVPNAPLMDLYRALWDYTLQYGYDRAQGGLFYTGKFKQPADQHQKEWWVQAEALVSALRMWRATHESKYWEVFEKTWEFTKGHQIDWERGEWHATVLPGGEVGGDKGNAWKAGYHNGRAMIECIELLSASS